MDAGRHVGGRGARDGPRAREGIHRDGDGGLEGVVEPAADVQPRSGGRQLAGPVGGHVGDGSLGGRGCLREEGEGGREGGIDDENEFRVARSWLTTDPTTVGYEAGAVRCSRGHVLGRARRWKRGDFLVPPDFPNFVD